MNQYVLNPLGVPASQWEGGTPRILNSYPQEKLYENSGKAALEDIFGPVISSYSRVQAVEDGVLIDVTSMAREAGSAARGSNARGMV